jgi:hypothetical protein
MSTIAPNNIGSNSIPPVAAWNIMCSCNLGLSYVAKGLAQMGVRCAILKVKKITNNWYPKLALGYEIICSKVTSHK